MSAPAPRPTATAIRSARVFGSAGSVLACVTAAASSVGSGDATGEGEAAGEATGEAMGVAELETVKVKLPDSVSSSSPETLVQETVYSPAGSPGCSETARCLRSGSKR